MKKFDWKERFKNKIFWVNTILAVATPIPILAYFRISGSNLTTWGSLFGLFLYALKIIM